MRHESSIQLEEIRSMLTRNPTRRRVIFEEADEVEVEEGEEYGVRSAVITAIASIRAKDGMTPATVLQFLETVLKVNVLSNITLKKGKSYFIDM